MEIENRVRRVVAAEAFVRVDQVKVDSKLVEDLDMDSMDRVQLAMALEDEFAIVLDDREVKNFRTVRQCVDLVIAALTPRAEEVRAEQRLVEAQLGGRA